MKEDWQDLSEELRPLQEKIAQAQKYPLLFIKLLGLKLEPWQEKVLRRRSIRVVP